ncbi:2564_t:CDS:2, partial [Cetraspora pellucida]
MSSQISLEDEVFWTPQESTVNSKTNNESKYCKICIKECEETCSQPYSYSKSDSSTEHLTHHLHDKHNITANNYKEHLDSSYK